jgi:hypothetical protein
VKIISLELFKVPPRWLFLKISTNEGITGWGEPIVEGRAETVRAAVKEFSNYLIGTDPFRIEDHFQVLYRGGFYRGGPVLTSALSGIEQALWDIKGRALGVPVYELLGGAAREKMRVYNWIGGDRPADAAESAKAQRAAGFTAVKMNATEELDYLDSPAKIDAAVARLAAVREAGGPELGIGIDFHGRVHKSMVKTLDARPRALPTDVYRGARAARERGGPARGRPPHHHPDSPGRAAVHPLGLQEGVGGRVRGHRAARSLARRRYPWRHARSPRWPRPSTSRSPRTALWVP